MVIGIRMPAPGCYRWLAARLRGFERARPKQLYRRFVETGGVVEVEANRVVVRFDKRSVEFGTRRRSGPVRGVGYQPAERAAECNQRCRKWKLQTQGVLLLSVLSRIVPGLP